MNGDNVRQPDAPELARGGGGNRYPVPDPTVLTTEALRREVDALQVLVEQRIGSLKELLQSEILSAKDYCSSQFEHIEQRLGRVEALRLEQKADMKAAVDAALTAQKEAVREQSESFGLAVAKSEAATAKAIEQLSLTTTTARDELRRGIDDAKERIADVERTLRGSISDVDNKVNAVNATARGGELSRASLFGWITAAVAIIGIVVVLANVITSGGTP
jgi:hypothetical protein